MNDAGEGHVSITTRECVIPIRDETLNGLVNLYHGSRQDIILSLLVFLF